MDHGNTRVWWSALLIKEIFELKVYFQIKYVTKCDFFPPINQQLALLGSCWLFQSLMRISANLQKQASLRSRKNWTSNGCSSLRVHHPQTSFDLRLTLIHDKLSKTNTKDTHCEGPWRGTTGPDLRRRYCSERGRRLSSGAEDKTSTHPASTPLPGSSARRKAVWTRT